MRAYADGETFAHSTFTVTTLGAEFVRGLRRTHAIEDFPAPGQTTTVEWQQGQQNFVITGVETLEEWGAPAGAGAGRFRRQPGGGAGAGGFCGHTLRILPPYSTLPLCRA